MADRPRKPPARRPSRARASTRPARPAAARRRAAGRASAPPPGPRERILRAAAASIARDGYDRLRMVALAEQVGISRAGLYKRFPDKESLLLAFLDDAIESWRHWTRESLGAAAGDVGRTGDAREAIGRWFRAGLTDPWHVTAVQILTADATQADLLTDRGATRRSLRETHRALTRVVARGVESGELRRELDVELTARNLQALLMGLLRNQVAERPSLQVARRRELDALVELVLRGLAAPGR